MNRYDLTLCIDGWDEARRVCYIKGGYANEAKVWEGKLGKWNAEFIVDDYDSTKIMVWATILV